MKNKREAAKEVAYRRIIMSRRRKRRAKDRNRRGVSRRSESKDDMTWLEIRFCMKRHLGY